MDREDVCDMVLDKATAAEFEVAVDRQVRLLRLVRFVCVFCQRLSYLVHLFAQYWYELVLDDLPMWGMVGEVLRDDAHGRMEKVINLNSAL